MQPAPVKSITCVKAAHGNAKRPRLGEQIAHRRSIARLDADPKLARPQIAQNRRHTAHMIAVRMREHHGIEPANVTRPQVRCDDLFTDIPTRVGGSWPDWATRVDEQCSSIRRDDEQRVTLADIDCRDLKQPTM